MPRPNLYGSAPVAAPARGGGGGNRNRNRNQGQGGGGGGKNKPSGGLYGGDAGEALTNQDPEAFIQDLLNRVGAFDSSGTAYGTWRNDTMAQKLLADYNAAQATNQSLNPADYFQQTYGAGFTNGPGKKNKGTVFNAGTLGSIVGPTADQYTDYQSNTDPLAYLAGKFQGGGLTMPGGGNTDFDRFLTSVFAPKLQSNLEAARAAGAVSPDGTLVTTPGNIMDTPVGALGGGGRRGRNRNRHMLPTIPGGDIRTAPGSAATAPGGGTMPISLNDFVAQQNLVDQARNMYAFRSNAERQPSPLALAGRYSWWG